MVWLLCISSHPDPYTIAEPFYRGATALYLSRMRLLMDPVSHASRCASDLFGHSSLASDNIRVLQDCAIKQRGRIFCGKRYGYGLSSRCDRYPKVVLFLRALL